MTDSVPKRSLKTIGRAFRLGESDPEDLSTSTTAEARLEMVRDLSERMWCLTGKPFPSYSRSEIPVQVIRG